MNERKAMPLDTREETTGAVYVLKQHIGNRAFVKRPYTNAERHDTDYFYTEGVYDRYPLMKKQYEKRRQVEQHKADLLRTWATKAIEALQFENPMPATSREVLPDVLKMMWESRNQGCTRPEICRWLNRDGGKVSGVLTDLHAAGIIFPLDGVRR